VPFQDEARFSHQTSFLYNLSMKFDAFSDFNSIAIGLSSHVLHDGSLIVDVPLVFSVSD
jgi:hypothetical protein